MGLKFWVKLPPVTYPDLAGMALGWGAQARARRGAQKSFRFDRESTVGKDGFEILGQSDIRSKKVSVLPRRARGAARKKVSVLTGNRFGWNRHAAKRRERWV